MHSQSETRKGPLPTLGPPARTRYCVACPQRFDLSSSGKQVEKKKLAAGVAEVSKKLLPLHPASTGGAFHYPQRKTFFRGRLGKTLKRSLPLHPAFERRNGVQLTRTAKRLQIFFCRQLGKSKKATTFAPRFNRKRITLKNETLSKNTSKKSFSEKLAANEKLLTFATRFDRKEGETRITCRFRAAHGRVQRGTAHVL